MLIKLQRSEKAVEEFQKEQKKGLIIKKEIRKLKLEDIQMLKEKQKRLEFKRKASIMQKEKELEDNIRDIKQKEQKLTKKKIQN